MTGWTTALVLHRWTGDWYAALLAGSLAAFNTDTLTRMAHIQAMHLEFLPLALLALDDVLRRGQASRRAAPRWLGGAADALLRLPARDDGDRARRRRRRAVWRVDRAPPAVPRARCSLAAAAMAIVICAPFLFQYYRVQHDQGLTRSVDEVRLYSGVWQNFIATGARLHFETWNAPLYREANSAAFPGVLPWLLALVAIGTGLAWRDARARMWLAIGVVGAALSFGPALPGLLAAVRRRSPCCRASALWRGSRSCRCSRWACWRHSAWPLIRVRLAARRPRAPRPGDRPAGGCWASTWRTRVPRWRSCRFDGIPAVYAALALEDAAVVAELPFPEPGARRGQRRGGACLDAPLGPLLNGYSGYTPKSYVDHYLAFRSFPDPASLDALRRAGVTHIVVDVARCPTPSRCCSDADGVRLIAADTRRRIYRIDVALQPAACRRP